MSTYVIGDIQGCYDEFQSLLRVINFNPKNDVLWFTGDLVNRGKQSLELLRYVSSLPQAITVLGNHDLTLLVLAYTDTSIKEHTLHEILSAPDRETLLAWLRMQPLIHEAKQFNRVLVHAGIPPGWSIESAIQYAHETEKILRSDNFRELLENMFGNYPVKWSSQLTGWDRHRFIINALTRMRFCDDKGQLDFSYKGKIESAPSTLKPWFKFKPKDIDQRKILFGHWAALEGKVEANHVDALDTGCLWGGSLTALRLEDNKKFQVSCIKK